MARGHVRGDGMGDSFIRRVWLTEHPETAAPKPKAPPRPDPRCIAAGQTPLGVRTIAAAVRGETVLRPDGPFCTQDQACEFHSRDPLNSFSRRGSRRNRGRSGDWMNDESFKGIL